MNPKAPSVTLHKPPYVRFHKQLCSYPIARSVSSKVDYKVKLSDFTKYYMVPGHEDVRISFLRNDIGVKPRVITGSDIRALMMLTGLVQRFGNPLVVDSIEEFVLNGFRNSNKVEQIHRFWNSIAMWQCVAVYLNGEKIVDRPIKGCELEVTGLRNGQTRVHLRMREKWLKDCMEGVKLYLPITGRVCAQNVILRTRGRGSEKSIGFKEFFHSIGYPCIDDGTNNEAIRRDAALVRAGEWYEQHGGALDYSIEYAPPKISQRRLNRGKQLAPKYLNTRVVKP